jgi:hypothetical protein
MKFKITFLILFPFSLLAQNYDVLFLGNSYTFYNNMPDLVSEIALSLDDTLNATSNTPGGWTLQSHAAQNSSSLQALNQQNWDFVVVQAQSQEPSFPPFQVEQQTYPYAQSLVDSILANDSCSEPMFFMTWGRKNGDAVNGVGYPAIATYEGMQSRLRNSYLEMGFDNDCSVSPVGMAWKKSIEQNPDFELYSGDGSHPNLAGSYLSACVFYSSIFKKSCEGSDFIPIGLDSTDAVILQTIASSVVLDSTEVWNLFDVQNVDLIRTEIDGYDFSVQASNYDSISWDFGDGQFSDQESIFHTYQVDQEFTIQLSIFSKNNCQKIEFSYNIDTYNVSDVEGFQSRANVYPNPSSRFFYVNIEEASTIFVFNLDGKKIIETAKDKSFKLDLNEVKNGVYFVRIINQNGVQNYKLIKNE